MRKHFIKIAEELTTNARKHISTRNFAIPEKAPGPGSYPVHDEAHAKAALHYVAIHGTPEERKRVRLVVYTKYPNLRKAYITHNHKDPLSENIVSKKTIG